MQAIQKYRADDGAEFDSEKKCIAHEELCAEIAKVMATLPKRPNDDGCTFSNGHGYLQHSAEQFWPAREALLRIGNKLFPHKWFDKSIADRSVNSSWAARLIGEASAPLCRAWERISCVDGQLREWGQPYYANNPNEAVEQHEVPAG